MAKKEPILINDEHGSVTRTAFRRLPKATKLELMEAWFRYRYEDPVHRSPFDSAEGGYQFIYGGPYDAEEEIRGQFEGLVPEALIDALVKDLESESFQWTQTPDDDDYDDNERVWEPPIIDIGSDEERRLRQTAIDALEKLKTALAEWPRGHGSIGHNMPPSPIEENSKSDLRIVTTATNQLLAELTSPTPDFDEIRRGRSDIDRISHKITNWIAEKGNLFADEFIKGVAGELGKSLVRLGYWKVMVGLLTGAFMSIGIWLHAIGML